MNQNNISSLVTYRRFFKRFKEGVDQGILDIKICNIALVGIAKDLNIVNPILL